MTTEFVDLKESMTVEEALERIRTIGLDSETIYNCYVTDLNRVLIGIVSIKDLLISNDKNVIINNAKFIGNYATADGEFVGYGGAIGVTKFSSYTDLGASGGAASIKVVKGDFVKNISISSTMGPGIKISLNSFDK